MAPSSQQNHTLFNSEKKNQEHPNGLIDNGFENLHGAYLNTADKDFVASL